MTLFLVMDPVGNIPTFVSILRGFPRRRAREIIIRELLIALAILILFLFLGRHLLSALSLSEPALGIAGAVILFLISIHMIFSDVTEMFGKSPDGEPFIVPLAVPLVAGPTAMTAVLLLMAQAPNRWFDWLFALIGAWFASGLILLLGEPMARFLGERGLTAIQRLMGMLLTAVSVQMLLEGIARFIRELKT
jgi:multiple antibiotic resistance protein